MRMIASPSQAESVWFDEFRPPRPSHWAGNQSTTRSPPVAGYARRGRPRGSADTRQPTPPLIHHSPKQRELAAQQGIERPLLHSIQATESFYVKRWHALPASPGALSGE